MKRTLRKMLEEGENAPTPINKIKSLKNSLKNR